MSENLRILDIKYQNGLVCVCARCLIASGSSVWVFSVSENLRILDIKYQNGLVCVCVCTMFDCFRFKCVGVLCV